MLIIIATNGTVLMLAVFHGLHLVLCCASFFYLIEKKRIIFDIYFFYSKTFCTFVMLKAIKLIHKA